MKRRLKLLEKKLIKNEQIENDLNKHNETVLIKELTKSINKNKTKPIDTSDLLKK